MGPHGGGQQAAITSLELSSLPANKHMIAFQLFRLRTSAPRFKSCNHAAIHKKVAHKTESALNGMPMSEPIIPVVVSRREITLATHTLGFHIADNS